MKDPAMLFYTSDFLTGVTLLNMKERGQYITLLCLQQQLGHMSLKQMQTAVGKMSEALMEKFIQDDEGLYYNRRADIEINKRKAHSMKQRENAQKRWSGNTGEEPEHIPNGCHGICGGNAMALPLENENEIESEIKNLKAPKEVVKRDKSTEKEEMFNTFWKAYPKKVGKKGAYKSFCKLPKEVWPKLVPAVETQKQSRQWQKDDGQYIPNPTTWLNQGRWDDELEHEGVRMPNAGHVDMADLKAKLARI